MGCPGDFVHLFCPVIVSELLTCRLTSSAKILLAVADFGISSLSVCLPVSLPFHEIISSIKTEAWSQPCPKYGLNQEVISSSSHSVRY